MLPPFGWLRQRIFGLAASETTFARRGFRGGAPAVRARLERVGATFALGFQAALRQDEERLTARLEAVELEARGFAYEGAATALALLDTLTPWRRTRWSSFLGGRGRAHAYMVHVGLGIALQRLRRDPTRRLACCDPLLGWLAIDGYGFAMGYFDWPRAVVAGARPGSLRGYARRAFDQGLGRSLWFVDGAEPERIQATIKSFAAERQADLWSGVGLACAYAGGIDGTAIDDLRARAARFAPQLAQGAAFAAKARQRAGNAAAHTDLACRLLCGVPSDEAAATTDAALAAARDGGSEPRYEAWRQQVQERLASRSAACA